MRFLRHTLPCSQNQTPDSPKTSTSTDSDHLGGAHARTDAHGRRPAPVLRSGRRGRREGAGLRGPAAVSSPSPHGQPAGEGRPRHLTDEGPERSRGAAMPPRRGGVGTHRHACPLPARGCRRVRTRLPARSAEKEAKPAAEGADSHIVEVHHMLHFLIFQKSVSGETYLINKLPGPPSSDT